MRNNQTNKPRLVFRLLVAAGLVSFAAWSVAKPDKPYFIAKYNCVFTCIPEACTRGNTVDYSYVVGFPFDIQPGQDPVQVATAIALSYIQKQSSPGISCKGPDHITII